ARHRPRPAHRRDPARGRPPAATGRGRRSPPHLPRPLRDRRHAAHGRSRDAAPRPGAPGAPAGHGRHHAGRDELLLAGPPRFDADLSALTADFDFTICDIRHPEAPGLLIATSTPHRWVFHVGEVPDGADAAWFAARVCASLGVDMPISVVGAMPWRMAGSVAE